MIVQRLLDWLSGMLAGFIGLIPPMTPEVSDAFNSVADSMATLSGMVANLGIIVPFEVLGACAAAWAAVQVFWGSVLALRFIVWVFGR